MDKELMDKEISKELKLKIEFLNGKLVLGMYYEGKGVTAETSVAVSADYFLTQLEAAIPGEYDDLLIEGLKKAFLV